VLVHKSTATVGMMPALIHTWEKCAIIPEFPLAGIGVAKLPQTQKPGERGGGGIHSSSPLTMGGNHKNVVARFSRVRALAVIAHHSSWEVGWLTWIRLD